MTTTERTAVLVDHGHAARSHHRRRGEAIGVTRGGRTGLDGRADSGGTRRILDVPGGRRVDG